jgi:hypothetical protein
MGRKERKLPKPIESYYIFMVKSLAGAHNTFGIALFILSLIAPVARSLYLKQSTEIDCPLMKVKSDFLVRAQYRSSVACSPELIINLKGDYIHRSFDGKLKSGVLSKLEMTRLKSRIAALDFAQIESQPFTGVCPTLYDGVEIIYTFPLGKNVEEISSCKYTLDGKNPLFQQINRLAVELKNKN